ncbi:MAG TPA: hypothetical protein VLR93_01750 [Patescibacteria group bacterium]|nr:hypothetical protein [Patescibacteria group bacterium]
MADQDEPRQAEPEEPTATPEPEDDTAGHNMGTYEYARQHANQKAREADAWASKEALRKQAKSPLDRLRGR